MSLKKNRHKIFFFASCFLLAASLFFSAFSYARYVTMSDIDSGSANTATIDCEVNVNNGGGQLSFINAPFLQKLTPTARPVRMNDWAESRLTVHNKGGSGGLKYEYSLVFYFPKDLGESMMFQLLELENASGREETSKVVDAIKASKMYGLFASGVSAEELALKEVDHICDNNGEDGVSCSHGTNKCTGTVKPSDDYAELSTNSPLPVDEESSIALLQSDTRRASVTGTFAASSKDSNNIQNFIAPVSVTKDVDLQYYRLTVNFSVAEKADYTLAAGQSKTFVLRLVLRKSQAFYDTEWDPSVYWNMDGAEEFGGYGSPIEGQFPKVDDNKFKVRWAQNPDGTYIFETDKDTGKIQPVLQIAAQGTEDWLSVSMTGCMGLTSPVKVAAVFTQTQK